MCGSKPVGKSHQLGYSRGHKKLQWWNIVRHWKYLGIMSNIGVGSTSTDIPTVTRKQLFTHRHWIYLSFVGIAPILIPSRYQIGK